MTSNNFYSSLPDFILIHVGIKTKILSNVLDRTNLGSRQSSTCIWVRSTKTDAVVAVRWSKIFLVASNIGASMYDGVMMRDQRIYFNNGAPRDALYPLISFRETSRWTKHAVVVPDHQLMIQPVRFGAEYDWIYCIEAIYSRKSCDM